MVKETNQTDEGESPQDLAIPHLAGGRTQAETATAVGVHRNTIYRWMQQPGFRERITAARRELLEQAASAAANAIPEAVRVLQHLMHNGELETTKLNAARALLTILLPLREQFDLAARIERLETQT